MQGSAENKKSSSQNEIVRGDHTTRDRFCGVRLNLPVTRFAGAGRGWLPPGQRHYFKSVRPTTSSVLRAVVE